MRSVLALLAALLSLSCTHQEAGEKAPRNAVDLGPWLLDPQPSGVVVAWTTPRASIGVVEFGQGGVFDRSAQDTAATKDHRVRLDRLQAGEKFDYRVAGEAEQRGTFTTAPAPDADGFQRPFKVLVYGDNRTNGGDHALVVRAAEAEGAALALHTGDMVVDAKSDKQWDHWFEVERDLLLHTPMIPTVGNHEITDHGVTYSRHFVLPGKPTFHASQYGNVHVLVLDSFEVAAGAEPHHGAVSDAQRAWAEAEVKTIPKDHHLWVLVHQGLAAHPVKLRPGHGGSAAVLALVKAVNAIHPVEATFAGHEHFYERGAIDGLSYFVLGGGGAPLEEPDPAAPGVLKTTRSLSFVTLDVCGCHVVGRAKDIAGRVIDEFVLASCPQACRTPLQGLTDATPPPPPAPSPAPSLMPSPAPAPLPTPTPALAPSPPRTPPPAEARP